jgi:hypothetical protein
MPINVELEERNRKRREYQERVRKQREAERISKAAEDKTKREDKPVMRPSVTPPPYMKQVQAERDAVKEARDSLVNPRNTAFLPTVRQEPPKEKWRGTSSPPARPVPAWRDEGLDQPSEPVKQVEVRHPWRAPAEPAMTPAARLFEEQGVNNPPPAMEQKPLDLYPALKKWLTRAEGLPGADENGVIRWDDPEVAEQARELTALVDHGIENPSQLRVAKIQMARDVDAQNNAIKRQEEQIRDYGQSALSQQRFGEIASMNESDQVGEDIGFTPGGGSYYDPERVKERSEIQAYQNANPLVDEQWALDHRARVLGLPYENETPEQKERREFLQGIVEGGVEAVGSISNLARNPFIPRVESTAERYAGDAWEEGKQDDQSWLDTLGTAGSTAIEVMQIPQRELSMLPSPNWDGSDSGLTVGQRLGVLGGVINRLLPTQSMVRDPDSGRLGLDGLVAQRMGMSVEQFNALSMEEKESLYQKYFPGQNPVQIVADTLVQWGNTQVQELIESNKRIEASSVPNADYALLNGVGGVIAQNKTYADLQAKGDLDSLRAQETWLAANGQNNAAQHVRQRIAELEGATNQDIVNRNAHAGAEAVFGTLFDPLNALDIPLGAAFLGMDVAKATGKAMDVLSSDKIADAVAVGKRAVEDIANGVTPGQTGYKAIDNLPFFGYSRVAKAHIDNDEVFTGVAQLINGVTNPGEARYLLEVWAQNPNLLIEGIPANRFSDPAILAHVGSDGMVRWGANQIASQEIMDRHWLLQMVVPQMGDSSAFGGTFNPAQFLADWDDKAWKVLSGRYNLAQKDVSQLASQWLLSDFARGIAVDLNLNFNPGHWVRNAVDARLKLGADGIYSVRPKAVQEATLGRWFGANSPTHRMFEAQEVSGVGQTSQVQAAFGSTPLAQFAQDITGNPDNIFAKAQKWAQENWMGNRRIGNLSLGEQANYGNGMDAAFSKLLSATSKDLVQGYTDKLVAAGVDPAIAKEFGEGLRHTILNGSGNGIANAQEFIDGFIYGENIPFNPALFGIDEDVLSGQGWAKVKGAWESWRRQPDPSSAYEKYVDEINNIIDEERERFVKMLRGNPKAIGEYTWTNQNVAEDGAAILDEIAETASDFGTPVTPEMQERAAAVTAQQARNSEEIAKAVAVNPDMAIDIWRDMQDLRDTTRRELAELNAIARNSVGDNKADAWEFYWQSANEMWDRVLAKEGEMLVKARQQIESGGEYTKRWSRWKDIDRYIEWDAADMRLVEDGLRTQGSLASPVGDDSPLNVHWQWVIDGNRAITDRSKAILAETVQRYASPDSIDILFDVSKQQELLGQQAKSYVAEQRALLFDGEITLEEYYKIRNSTWAEYTESVVVLNSNAARYVVLRAGASDIGANISFTDGAGLRWFVEGVTDDTVLVRGENGLTEQLPRSVTLEPYIEQYENVLASVDGKIDEVVTDVRASTGGELPDEGWLQFLEGTQAPQTIGESAFLRWRDMKARASEFQGEDAARWQEFDDWFEREIPRERRDEYLGMTPDEVIRRAAADGIAPPPSIDTGGQTVPSTLENLLGKLAGAEQERASSVSIGELLGIPADADREMFVKAVGDYFLTDDQSFIGLREQIEALPLSQVQKDALWDHLEPRLADQMEADIAANGFVSTASPDIYTQAGVGRLLDDPSNAPPASYTVATSQEEWDSLYGYDTWVKSKYGNEYDIRSGRKMTNEERNAAQQERRLASHVEFADESASTVQGEYNKVVTQLAAMPVDDPDHSALKQTAEALRRQLNKLRNVQRRNQADNNRWLERTLKEYDEYVASLPDNVRIGVNAQTGVQFGAERGRPVFSSDGARVNVQTGEILGDAPSGPNISWQNVGPDAPLGFGGLGVPEGENANTWVWREMRGNGITEPPPFGADYARHHVDMLDGAFFKLTENVEQFLGIRRNTMTPRQRATFAETVRGVQSDIGNIVYASARQAKTMVDRAMIDNTHRRGFDNWLGIVLPFHYFWSRSGWNWGRRMVRKPSLMNMATEMQQATMRENEQQELPVRLEGTVPFLNLPSGVQVRLQNPLLAIFPWVQYAPNRRFINEDEAGSDFGKWYNAIRQWSPGMLPQVSLAADAIQDRIDPLPNGGTRVGRNYIGQYIPQYEVLGQATGALGLGNLPGSVDTFQPYRIDRAINILGVSGNVPSATVAYARQIVYNTKNGVPPEQGIPPAQFEAANALYQQGVQQASMDRLATVGGRMTTGVGGYVWRPEEQELARQAQIYFAGGYDPHNNPYGSRENQNQLREGLPGLGNWLNKGVNAPYPDPEMRTPAQNQQVSEYMQARTALSEQQQREISHYISQNPDATEKEIWEIRDKYQEMRKQLDAQYNGVSIPEGGTAGMNPQEMAEKIVGDFAGYQPPNKPVYPGDDASPEEKAAYYKAKGAWEQKRLDYIDKNARYALQRGEDMFNEQGIVEPFQYQLNRMLEGEYAADVARESDDRYRSPLEADWQNQVDFEKEMSNAERAARGKNVERLTGFTADEWAVYAAASPEQRRELVAQNPAYREMSEAAYNPQEYAKAVELFGDDWYKALQAEPLYPGEATPEYEAAFAAWLEQYPNAMEIDLWYNGRPTLYSESPDGYHKKRDYGTQWQYAIDRWGDDIFALQRERAGVYSSRGKEAGWAWDDAHGYEVVGRIRDYNEWRKALLEQTSVFERDAASSGESGMSVNEYAGARPVGTSMTPIGASAGVAGGSVDGSDTSGRQSPPAGLQQAPAVNPFMGDPANGGWWTPGGSSQTQGASPDVIYPEGYVHGDDTERYIGAGKTEPSQGYIDFQNSRDGVYNQFGDTVGYLWDRYQDLPKGSQERRDFVEQNPELRLTFAYSNNPEKYTEAQELFGDDALMAWAFKPSGDAAKEYYIQNPQAWAVNAWMYGRWDDEKEETGSAEYNFGADWAFAIEQFGDDIWQVAMQYRAGDKATRNAMWDERLGAFWSWWYGERDASEQSSFAGDGSAPLYHDGDFAWQGMTYNRFGQLLDSNGNVAFGYFPSGGGGGGGGGGGSYSRGGGGSAPRVYAQDMNIRSARVPDVRVEEARRNNLRPTATRTPDELGSWRPRSGLSNWRAGNVERVPVARVGRWRS